MLGIANLEEIAAQHDLLYLSGKSPDDRPEVYLYSRDKKYRYAFARWWREGSLVLWVLLNPTTRDTEGGRRRTLHRCVKWSQDWGGAGLVIANLFAFRHNDPDALRGIPDPVGPCNDAVLTALSKSAERTIVAWGQKGQQQSRAAKVGSRLTKPLCLGVTATGQPRHPLYVLGNTSVEPWPVTQAAVVEKVTV
jgi:hypothetical protein